MDEQAFDEMAARLKKVNGVITQLDPAIRTEAFTLLKDYIGGGQLPKSSTTVTTTTNGTGEEAGPDLSSADSFFITHEGGKPAENAYLIAGYLYSEHGSEAFSIEDVKAVAKHVGLTLPDRVDVTLGGAKKNGKLLFRKPTKGKLQPNVHGETFLKEKYSVTKGTKSRSA